MMLLRQSASILIAFGMLGLVTVAGPASAADDCKLPGAATVTGLPNGHVGRPCITITTDPGCVPYGFMGYPQYGSACTHYVVLYPIESGGVPMSPGDATDEFDKSIVWVETNGVPGLQMQGGPTDLPILL